MERRIRVLVAKPGLDGHDRGAKVIARSILSGAHNVIVPRVMELLRERGLSDVVVLVGGIIPDEDAARLKQLGVAAVFQPGASLESIISFINEHVHLEELPVSGN